MVMANRRTRDGVTTQQPRDMIGRYSTWTQAAPGISLSSPRIHPGLVDLSPAAWEILEACRSAGGRPLIVGGSVRDGLYGQLTGEDIAFKDIDIEVHGTTTDELKNVLPGRMNEQGRQFGILAVTLDEQAFDVSVPRRDSKTGDGHGGFAVDLDPGITLDEAFARRDYTINSMGWDPYTGELIDPFGGAGDLADGILRHTRAETFPDDPLRPLRAVQFAARFRMDIHPETIELCRSMKDTFAQLPPSRVWGELDKLVTMGREPSRGLEALYATGIAEHFPELMAVRGCPQDPVWHPEGPVDVHLGLAADAAAEAAAGTGATTEERRIAVLSALLHDFGKAEFSQVHPDGGISNHGHAHGGVGPAEDFMKAAGVPNDIRAKVLPLIREHMRHVSLDSPTPSAVRRLMRDLAGEKGNGPSIADWARLVDADLAGRGPGAKPPVSGPWLAVAETVKVIPPILRGEHLAAAGIPRGQEWGWIVRASLAAQDEGAFDTEEGAVAWALANREAVIAVERPRWEASQARRKNIQELRVGHSRAQARAARAAKAGMTAEALAASDDAGRLQAEMRRLQAEDEAERAEL